MATFHKRQDLRICKTVKTTPIIYNGCKEMYANILKMAKIQYCKEMLSNIASL